jgi:N-acetyl-anhydromuramyl-L-alanine amidase AmpD
MTSRIRHRRGRAAVASGVAVLAGALLMVMAGGVAGGVGPARTAAHPSSGSSRASAAIKPPIKQNPIVFGAKRQAETAAYCKRHYHLDSALLYPKVIVLHFTAGNDWRSAWNLFAQDIPDAELHELPGPASHFIIDQQGVIHQVIPLKYRGRHTFGLNYTAIGIEFAQATGPSASWADQQILGRTKQINAGLRLVKWLMAKYHIKVTNVIGHSMAHTSPYYKDYGPTKIPDHSDWQKADVRTFRSRLGAVN